MFSSLILSMAMSASPTPVIENDSLIINEIGRLRGSIKVNDQKLDKLIEGKEIRFKDLPKFFSKNKVRKNYMCNVVKYSW